MLEHVLSQPWLGSDFSSRIWVDQDKLLRELKQELSRAFVLGEPLKKTTKRVAERMGYQSGVLQHWCRQKVRIWRHRLPRRVMRKPE